MTSKVAQLKVKFVFDENQITILVIKIKKREKIK